MLNLKTKKKSLKIINFFSYKIQIERSLFYAEAERCFPKLILGKNFIVKFM